MKCEALTKIHNGLEELYDILKNILPISELDMNPFEYFENSINTIYKGIKKAISDAEAKYIEMKKKNMKLLETIKSYCNDLEINTSVCEPLPDNLCVSMEILKNEMSRIKIYRDRVEDEIKMVCDEIKMIARWIGYEGEGIVSEGCISIKRLKGLKLKLLEMRNKKEDLEKKRDNFYEEIRKFSEMLGIECEITYEETIFELENAVSELTIKISENEKRFNEILDEIRISEGILGIKQREFERSYKESHLEEMEKYQNDMREKRKKQFNEIYERTAAKLEEIGRIFGISVGNYEKSEDGLREMMTKINELRPKQELFCGIVELLEKRRLFIEKMTNFEKIASDPKRLFKSSFQLNSEEKFRNTAYPILLNLEKNIFAMIDKYEKTFGKFIFEGEEYKNILKVEIENRIINRTVFISKCESPFKKRK